MNERIEELAKQAGFCGTGFHNTLPGTTQEDALKKFAELIVRDCTSSIELYKNNSVTKEIAAEGVYSYESGCVAGMDESILIIKKHFGVE